MVYMKYFSCILCILLPCSIAFADEITPIPLTSYQVYMGVADSSVLPPLFPRKLAVLRTFFYAEAPHFLAVDPQTMQTEIHPLSGWHVVSLNDIPVDSFWRETPYGRALYFAHSTDDSLHDAGLEHVNNNSGIVLTIDLCPSLKPLDRRLILRLISSLSSLKGPVPMSFSITGVWMREHPADLTWLQELEDSGKVDITWINHTDRHRYIKGVPERHDFMLIPGTHVDSEIIDAEVEMLRAGLLPSPFFRFPGLVSDRALVDRVIALGLIPIGTDAWLAKNQKAHMGSIVLIHGNGNEPLGVQRFLQLLQRESPEIKKHHWSLLDLSESVAQKF